MPYQLWDVFTDRPLAGNQLAVVPDGDNVSPALMQQIANELSLSETVFLLSPENPACLSRFRIFTPQRELPMAGHPTIGATFALARLKKLTVGTPQVSIEIPIGPTNVDLKWHEGKLESAWMAQKAPEFGPGCEDAELIGRVLGLDSACIVPEAPAQVVSSGVPLLFVCVRSRADVDRATLNRQELKGLVNLLDVDECPVYIFTLDKAEDEALAYSRMFAPMLGIEEDPATGGANGPLLGYISRYFPASVSGTGPFLNRQGVKMGRPSAIYLVPGDGTNSSGFRIGGQAIHIGDGTLHV
ncbi:MAG: PhzF family phenazine biosynthesis protein [Pseudomonadales bacterium]|nr:PhzF family phenazine biosynthesis protein [Pseudomonadales bacterium]